MSVPREADLLLPAEVAAMLRYPEGLSNDAVRKRIKRAGIPYLQSGHEMLVERQAFERWKAARRRAGAAAAVVYRSGGGAVRFRVSPVGR